MSPEIALSNMREAVALWYVGEGTAAGIVYAACELLVAELDGPSLCMLAAVSVVHADEEVPKLLESALHDVGLAYYPKGSDAAQENGLRLMASRVLSGHLTPIALAAWAHATFDHGTLELAERLVELGRHLRHPRVRRDLTADDLRRSRRRSANHHHTRLRGTRAVGLTGGPAN